MRTFALFICAALCLGFTAKAADQNGSSAAAAVNGTNAPKDGQTYIVGISPYLQPSAKDTVFQGIVRLIVEGLPLNSKLEVYDAYNLKSITRLSVPGAKVFNSPKTRANQFASPIGEIREFLARDNAKGSGDKPMLDGSIRLPQFCDFLAQDRPSQDGEARLPLLLIGSPLYQDAREPAFSMTDGYFPSDGHLRASREESVFGLSSGNGAAPRLQVDWAYFGEPWLSDLHREKVTRFWALYLERRDGRLASFSSDLATAMNAFNSGTPGAPAASNGWVADASQTKPEMVRATRNVELVDWLTGDAQGTTTPPSRMTGPMKIGIRWKADIDLDLYATPRKDAETLFFEHTKSPEGYYFKDHRFSPGREYEYIEFESPVDIREVKSFVNFYGGSCPGGPRGEVRIEFLNHIYSGSFAIESSDGNQGRAGKAQKRCWTEIPIREILRIGDETARASTR
ncbi:MAG TPA: hypothetical protein VGO67_21735 [Verrucomicrobiae bacterium]|jgi:hypothetical protein